MQTDCHKDRQYSQKSQKSDEVINKTCKIISNCNLLFEDQRRKEQQNDDFYKVKKQRDDYNKTKNKVGHIAYDTSILGGKMSISDYRLNKIYASKSQRPEEL